MNTSRLAVISALACLLAWTLKGVAIGVAGGLNLSPFEGPLFLAGMVASLATVVLLALAVTGGRPLPVRVLAVAAAAAATFALVAAMSALVDLVRPADGSWVWSELNLWVLAVVLLGSAVAVRRPSPAATGARPEALPVSPNGARP